MNEQTNPSDASSGVTSLQLITYQLGELSKSVEKISAELVRNNTHLNERIAALELWRASFKGAQNDRRMITSTIISWIVAIAAFITAALAWTKHR